MLMVIFGAGASFDSSPDYAPGPAVPNRPPLADDLFAARFADDLQVFPECLAIAPRLRMRADGVTVEAVLDELQRESETDTTRLKQLAAVRWYLHYMLWKCGLEWNRQTHRVTNYRSLLDEIRYGLGSEANAIFVTFNYDLLLDEAMPVVGVDTQSLDGYISNPSYRLVKLHGSVNWAHPVETPLKAPNGSRYPDFETGNELIQLAPSLSIGADFRIIQTYPMAPIQEASGFTFPFPAIAIPLLRKDRFECPKQHLDRLREMLPKLTHLLIIGWRGAEENFVKMIQDAVTGPLSRVAVVAGTDADGERLVKTLREANIVADNMHVFGRGFTAFMQARQIGSFLQR